MPAALGAAGRGTRGKKAAELQKAAAAPGQRTLLGTWVRKVPSEQQGTPADSGIGLIGGVPPVPSSEAASSSSTLPETCESPPKRTRVNSPEARLDDDPISDMPDRASEDAAGVPDRKEEDRSPEQSPCCQRTDTGLSLRDRLARRGARAEAPIPTADELSPQALKADTLEHRPLGGLALRWRLTLQKREETCESVRRKKNAAESSSSGVTETRNAVTTPSRKSSTKALSSESLSKAGACDVGALEEETETPPPPASQKTKRPRSSTPSPASGSDSGANGNSSIKSLKDSLTEHRIDYSGCVEKSDLQALWNKFESLRARPMEELRWRVIRMSGGRPVANLNDIDDYARALLSETRSGNLSSPSSERASNSMGRNPSESSQRPFKDTQSNTAYKGNLSTSAKKSREEERVDSIPFKENCTANYQAKETTIDAEITRLLTLKKSAFSTPIAWGFAVLGVQDHNIMVVQRCYRTLMKKMHPDKAGDSPSLAQAMEVAREAKDICERALSRLQVPEPPRHVCCTVLCDIPGKRRLHLKWDAARDSSDAPVRRYLVAAFDPTFGRSLTITVLEPDYSAELRRFVSVNELCEHILAEEEMPKMTNFFRQRVVTLQVASANEAGQSRWETIQARLQ